jgi:hypothetical protein
MANLNKFGVPLSGNTSAVLMPKLAYRFRVTFTGLGGTGTDTKALTREIISVGRPNFTHDEVVIDVYNSRIFLAGKHTWEPLQIVMRDDINSDVITLLNQQVTNQVDHFEQSAAQAGSQYKFTTIVETLDGTSSASSVTTVLDSWSLSGCFVQNMTWGESNYATSEPVQITMTVRYDNAEHLVGTENTLSVQNISSTTLDQSTATA